jgi:negative regulator of sigma E activity
LLESYAFNIAGKDRVAGRAATLVTLAPAQNDRYGYKLWIDDQSKLLLKSVIVGPDGHALEHVQFIQISILDQIAAELLRPDLTGTGFNWHTEADNGVASPAAPADLAWKVGWLPAGFEFRESNVQNMATSHAPVTHLVYSDGLAMVSVFVEAVAEGQPALQGYSSRGAVNAFSRVSDKYQITVVGEVPLRPCAKLRPRWPRSRTDGAMMKALKIAALTALATCCLSVTTVWSQDMRLPDFSELAKKNSPAVVNISTTVKPAKTERTRAPWLFQP